MPVEIATGDLPAAGEADKLLADRPDVIFHLAAIVSGEAEQDFDKGYRINMDGTRGLLEAVRTAGHKPRLVFASSIAVFGAPFPEAIGDEFFNTPLTSYGTQKNICELLISDYSRKGFVDGISIRLPTICVRPGKPNKAASGFFSNIMREPLAGAGGGAAGVRERHALARLAARRRRLHAARRQPRHWPRSARAAPLTMPGLAVTVGEQIAALQEGRRRQGGGAHPPRARSVHRGRSSPAGRASSRPSARSTLGFKADASFEDIIRIHIEDELGGKHRLTHRPTPPGPVQCDWLATGRQGSADAAVRPSRFKHELAVACPDNAAPHR